MKYYHSVGKIVMVSASIKRCFNGFNAVSKHNQFHFNIACWEEFADWRRFNWSKHEIRSFLLLFYHFICKHCVNSIRSPDTRSPFLSYRGRISMDEIDCLCFRVPICHWFAPSLLFHVKKKFFFFNLKIQVR